MELLGTFETISQIAIALTGFTGVVVALGRGGPDGWGPSERFLLRALLYWSLGTAFLALVPSGLARLPAVAAPWRVAHGLFAVFHASVFVWFFRESARLALPIADYRPNLVIIPVGLAILAAEVLVACGLLGDAAPFLYFVALLWFLFLASRVFVALVVPAQRPDTAFPTEGPR